MHEGYDLSVVTSTAITPADTKCDKPNLVVQNNFITVENNLTMDITITLKWVNTFFYRNI